MKLICWECYSNHPRHGESWAAQYRPNVYVHIHLLNGVYIASINEASGRTIDFDNVRKCKTFDECISFFQTFPFPNLMRDLFHLWVSRHLAYVNGAWVNTGRYEGCVNGSSGLYWTNHSANNRALLANDLGLDEHSLRDYNREAFTYYAKFQTTTIQ